MKQISEIAYNRLMLVEFENEKLKAENSFLHSVVCRSESAKQEVFTKFIDKWTHVKICNLDLSIRAANALAVADIYTVADLLLFCKGDTSRERLKSIRNMGENSIREIIEYMDENKLNWY